MLSQEEIDSLLSTLSVGLDKPAGATATTSSAPNQGHEAFSAFKAEDPPIEKRNLKLYNFRRPDKFSKDHLRALQTIHESFARQLGLVLTAYLRMTVEIDVVSVDQLTYDEFIRTMPSPMTVSIMEMEPLTGQVLLGIGYEVTSSMINRMLGGTGIPDVKPRELTDIEQLLIRRIIDRANDSLEESWRSVQAMRINVVGMEESYALIQVASSGEIVALITFEVKLGNRDSGLMSLCIPYPVLENVISQLSAQHIFHSQHTSAPEAQQNEILTKLSNAKIPLQIYLGGCKIKVRDLVDIRQGDVVRLDRMVTDDLLISVNGYPKFLGKPGSVKKQLAVCITDTVEDVEAIEGFGVNG
jgi:flagellar motor switch protein FliM